MSHLLSIVYPELILHLSMCRLSLCFHCYIKAIQDVMIHKFILDENEMMDFRFKMTVNEAH